MTEHSLVLLVCVAVILGLAILVYVGYRIHVASRTYVDSCAQISAVSAAYELSQTLQQILVNTEKIQHSLKQHRRVLYDAHKRICAVTKGSEKPAL
jgi:preprotein translocase subunit Sss1